MLVDFVYAVWLDRIKDPDALEEFDEWVENGSGDEAPTTVSKTEFILDSDGEIG